MGSNPSFTNYQLCDFLGMESKVKTHTEESREDVRFLKGEE